MAQLIGEHKAQATGLGLFIAIHDRQNPHRSASSVAAPEVERPEQASLSFG